LAESVIVRDEVLWRERNQIYWRRESRREEKGGKVVGGDAGEDILVGDVM
jgi:hypothetical protein